MNESNYIRSILEVTKIDSKTKILANANICSVYHRMMILKVDTDLKQIVMLKS